MIISGSNRVIRGGSWNNNAQNLRSAQRNDNGPDNHNNNVGFRLVSTANCPLGVVYGWHPSASGSVQIIIQCHPTVKRGGRIARGSQRLVAGVPVEGRCDPFRSAFAVGSLFDVPFEPGGKSVHLLQKSSR